MPSGSKYSQLLICMQCKQQCKFYVFNTGVVIVFFPILALFSVAEDNTEIADRMSIVLTLLLTMATYKIVIADWIPQKDYVTFMDWYIVIGFILVLVIAFVVTGSGWFYLYGGGDGPAAQAPLNFV